MFEACSQSSFVQDIISAIAMYICGKCIYHHEPWATLMQFAPSATAPFATVHARIHRIISSDPCSPIKHRAACYRHNSIATSLSSISHHYCGDRLGRHYSSYPEHRLDYDSCCLCCADCASSSASRSRDDGHYCFACHVDDDGGSRGRGARHVRVSHQIIMKEQESGLTAEKKKNIISMILSAKLALSRLHALSSS